MKSVRVMFCYSKEKMIKLLKKTKSRTYSEAVLKAVLHYLQCDNDIDVNIDCVNHYSVWLYREDAAKLAYKYGCSVTEAIELLVQEAIKDVDKMDCRKGSKPKYVKGVLECSVMKKKE